MTRDRSSLGDRFLGACLMFLVAAFVLSFAVHLILSLLGPLLVIGGIVGAIAGLVWYIRRRQQTW